MIDGSVIIAGGTGFIGRALTRALCAAGVRVVVLTRSPEQQRGPATYVPWDGRSVGRWAGHLDGARAVVNLAGKNVNCRYTHRALNEIDRSRVESVHAIAEAIHQCARPPCVWVQASTTAIFGDGGERWCDETTPIGQGVPVHTAAKWEAAFHATETLTPATRRVLVRISFAMGRDGGALGVLAKLTRLYLGGTVASGRQYMSWIHIADLVRLFQRALDDESMRGLYVAAAPAPVTNAQFMASLRRVLRRPWSPPTPAWAVHVGSFLMRTEPVLALTGRRCRPRRLLNAGFAFQFGDLDAALADLFGGVEAQRAAAAR